MGSRILVVGVLALGAACSPFGNGNSFACSEDVQCGAGGTCTGGYCAFADSSCSSGERYGAASGPNSNQCVGAATSPDASMPGSGGGPDAFVFEDAPAPDTVCYGSGFEKTCFAAAPATPLAINGAVNTDTSALCATDVLTDPPWCVIAGSEVTLTGTVVATGGKPLVIVAADKLDIQGSLSAASTRAGGEVIGASADFATCNAGTPPTAGKGGGGAGGSFGGTGGDGGNGGGGDGAGTHGATQVPAAMRGGCPGQNGDGNGGAPGHGGGALALIAGAAVSIEGSVDASGEAGAGGQHPNGGGGGGGAGGLIVLDAPTVTSTGAIFCNGGGGAEASGNQSDGKDGNDPTVTGAAGTNGGSPGGQGGAGGFGATAAAPGGSVGGHAGGGGGGGVGVIELYQATSIGGGGAVSPPPS